MSRPEVVTNFDLEKVMNTSDEWIQQRSGIIESATMPSAGVGSSDLAIEASLRAIESAGIDKSEIDFIIAATISPDHYFPGIGVMIQAKLGLSHDRRPGRPQSVQRLHLRPVGGRPVYPGRHL